MKKAQVYFTNIFKHLAIALFALPVVLFVLTPRADAATGILKQINFQGKVVNTNGTNVANASYNFLFCLYTVASPATPCTAGANNDAVWRESKSLTVTDGVFQTLLGDTTALPGSVDFNTDNIYLGVNFNSDGQMTPLVRFSAVPYAFNADKIHGLTVTDTTGTFTLTNGKTLSVSNTLTFAGTDSTTITFQGTDTYVGRTTSDTLTNKTIGSSGLTFSAATTDITTVSNEDLTLAVNGSGNFVFSTDFDSGITLGTAISNEFPLLVRSGIGNNAALAIDNLNSGDLFTASSAGTTKFSITSAGGIKLGTAEGINGDCLKSGGAGAAATYGSCGAGSSPFTDDTGFTYMTDTAEDFVLGGSTIAAATFYVDVSAGVTYLGKNNTGAGGVNGGLTFYSSGNGIVDPTIITDASGNLTISAGEAGASVIVGDGSGNISLSLTAAADGLIADKTVALAAAYSGTDFTFTRVLTSDAASENMSGAVLYVSDTSTGLSNNTATGDLILGNAALTTTPFTGNLLKLQKSGTTEFVINATGQVGSGVSTPVSQLHVTRPLSYTATGKALAIFDQIENQDILTASAAATPIFTITRAGGIKLGTAEGINGDCLKSGGAAAASTWGSCGAGGGGGSNFTLDTTNGVIRANNNVADFLIGGTSTSSAKFVFGGLNAGTPTATFSGDLIINNKPSTAVANMQKWAQITGTAGTIGGGATTAIASVSASVVYNGSLYVGTNKANAAEIYRYNGDGAGTWTSVSGTAGTIGGGATTAIDMVSSMTVYNGYLYIGTDETDKAEVYRYDGGSTWTKVTQAAGTVRTGGTATIDGISSMVVHGGKMFIGTRENTKAEIYRYESGTSWIIINTTAGLFVTTNTAAVNSIPSMISYMGSLYFTTSKPGDADFGRYTGVPGTTGVPAVIINAAGTTGSFNVYNTESGAAGTVTAGNEINLSVYQGKIVLGFMKINGSDVLQWTPPDGSVTNVFVRLTSATGTVATGGTVNIDGISAITVYNGRLYVGTSEASAAEIYRYNQGAGDWTKVSQNTAGMIASAGTGSIDRISTLIPLNHNSLFAGTLKATSAEGYNYVVSIDQSYALRFHAGASQAGGEQNSQQNLASILFVASLSANVNNKAGNTGSFVFTHSVTTSNGSYDVAEDYPTRDDTLEPGDVVSIDPYERNFVKKSEGDYDYTAIGVYSEKPALRLSQDADQINGGRVIPIALAGRAPVKVNTENGEIKQGDPLTPSSTPGIAMKAKKSGLIIGQAMEGYDGEGVGKVMTYIKSSSYNGSIAGNFTNIDLTSETFSKDVLAQLMANPADGKSSIVTDRLIAGLEIITPRVLADEIETNRLFAHDGTFSGTLTADVIRANKIEGLEFSIRNEVLNMKDLLTTPGESLDNGSEDSGIISQVKNLFEGFVEFLGQVIFRNDVEFEGEVVFNKDSAGYARIQEGQKFVEVVFEKEYANQPVVNASVAIPNLNEESFKKYIDEGFCEELEGIEVCQDKITDMILNGSIKYAVKNQTTKGFLIFLSDQAPIDMTFSWQAIAVKDVKTVVGEGPAGLVLPFEGDYLPSNKFGEHSLDPKIKDKDLRLGLKGHDGLDIAVPMETPILAVDGGEVELENNDYGTTIYIKHSWGRTVYGHLSERLVGVGDKVTKGQKIALSGNSGLTTGPHLHFGIKLNNSKEDNGYAGFENPWHYLSFGKPKAPEESVAGISTQSASLRPSPIPSGPEALEGQRPSPIPENSLPEGLTLNE